MIRFIYISFFILSLQSLFAHEIGLLNSLSEKVKTGQVLAAYQELEQIDPLNQDVEVFLLKLNLALDFHIVQIQYEKFGFVNLEAGQSIDTAREKSGIYSLFTLKVPTILDSLIQQYPEDARLYKAQSDYYYECFLNYDQDIALSQDDLKQRLELAAQQAVSLGSADGETFFILGFLSLEKENYQSALEMFQASMLLNNENYLLYNHLAYAEFGLNNLDAAIHYAKKAISNISDLEQKVHSYRILSFSYDNKNYTDSAIYFLEEGLQHNTDVRPELLRDYLYIAVREHLPIVQRLVNEIISLHPESPEVYNAVINTFYQENGDFQQMYQVLERMEVDYAKNEKILSNVYFYQGQILYEIDAGRAKDKLKKAKEEFEKYFPPTHEVFQVIQQYLDGL